MTILNSTQRRAFVFATLAAACGVAVAQANKPGSARIGILWMGYPTGAPRTPGVLFRNRLRQLGWEEGRNLTIEHRFVGDGETIPAAIEQLLAMKVQVIVAMGSPIAMALRNSPVPVVFSVAGDPVSLGMIDSFGHPGHNMTGIYAPTVEHAGKRLSLLLDVVPGSTRIALLSAPVRGGVEASNTETAAGKLGVQLIPVKPDAVEDLESGILACMRAGATALTILTAPRIRNALRHVAAMCLAHKLPSIAGYGEYARMGGLMSYGASADEAATRPAYFVARILSGTRPADLPVEQSLRYVLTLNNRTASALGISFPKPMLQYADQVIS